MAYLKENILIALEGIVANKMRALLTMLGIVIGIGSVITITTVGDALAAYVADSMSKLGVTNILVSLQNKDAEALSFLGGSLSASDRISDDMVQQYTERYQDSIDSISLSNVGSAGQARNGNAFANTTIMGANDELAKTENIKLLEGRFIKDADIKSKRYVAVVSDKFVKNLYPSGQDCLGQEIKIDTTDGVQTFTVVGVYQYEASLLSTNVASSDKDLRTYTYIPLTTLYLITSSDQGYLSITVKTKSNVDIARFTNQTRDFFNAFYTNNPNFNISATSLDSMLTIVSDVMGTLSTAVGVIAGISLVVGGIGIMNIMLVSVTERFKEIGMRKAIGARNSSIQIQFIVEAVVVSGLGGIVGIVLGIALGYAGSSLLGRPRLPSVNIIVISVLFSMLIGVFFGFYPANKAANLDPADALRFE